MHDGVNNAGELAKVINRSLVYVRDLQARLELPVQGPFSRAYLAFLKTFVALRTLNISEETLRELWHLERKLLELLHADSTGSQTWLLDSCGATAHRERRLLLSNFDMGVALTAPELQPGLNSSESLAELFSGQDMGEGALRVLRECIKLRARILAEISAELPHVRSAVKWAGHL
jgi:hypothetical protein